MKLRYFQTEAIAQVLSSYKCKKMRANIVMALGTGKTYVILGVLDEINKINDVKSIAYVSSHQSQLSHFKLLFNENSSIDKEALCTFKYDELIDILHSNKIRHDAFQVVVFEDIAHNIKDYYYISQLISGFKLGVSSVRVNPDSLIYKNVSENIVYNYSLKQSIDDGYSISYNTSNLTSITNSLRSKVKTLDSESMHAIDIEIEQLNSEREQVDEILELIKEGKLNKDDISELSYRKSQLVEFKRLLDDELHFLSKASEFNGKEAVWQNFFESNQWIFGFGLSYLFNSSLEGKKLEQTIDGFSVKGNGKRIDALLKTNGLIQSLCFAEIKTHQSCVLKEVKNAYRPDSWAISDELSGGIAQVQRTVHQSINNLSSKLNIKSKDGCETGETIYQYKPRSFLIIGSLNQFKSREGYMNESKYSSFELFRRSVSDVEIITFDELYERANAIVNMQCSL